MDWVTTCMMMEEVGSLGYIFACTFGIGSELVCDAIVLHGTDEQKEKYVAPLLRGEKFAAECLTEPRGGSDFFGTTTTRGGSRRPLPAQWAEEVHCRRGGRRFLPRLCSGRTLTRSLTRPYLLHRGPDGRSRHQIRVRPHGMSRRRAGRVVFKDVKVPKENVVGRLHGAYGVFNTMMVPERLGTAAMTIGAARPALDVATSYTTRRKAFGQVINQFQGVSFQVAEAAMLLDASRSMVLHDRSRRGRRFLAESDPQDGLPDQEVCH